MILDRVTMTGADDSVDARSVIQMARIYPFAEFGILFSEDDQATRFPSEKWLYCLHHMIVNDYYSVLKPQLSAHICGQWVKDLLQGKNTIGMKYSAVLSHFQRIQLNFHGADHSKYMTNAGKNLLKYDPMFVGKQIIFQLDEVNDSLYESCAADLSFNAVGLVDGSHGAGVSPKKWSHPFNGLTIQVPVVERYWSYCGFAGGIGPDNIEREIRNIDKFSSECVKYYREQNQCRVGSEARVWIDMETKIRSNNDQLFDWNKVEECLKVAQRHVVK